MGIKESRHMKNASRITLLSSQDKALRKHFSADPAGHEQAAAVLFRRLHRQVEGLPDSDRYIAVEVIPFEKFLAGWII